MAKWTLEEFIRSLREKIDEVGMVDSFTDAELTKYINQGLFDLNDSLRLEGYGNATVTNAVVLDYKEIFFDETQTELSLSEREHNFYKMRTIVLNGVVLPVGTVEDQLNGDEVVALWGEKLKFKTPITGLLECYYLKKPRTLAGNLDKSDVPEQYQHIVLDFAFAQCKRKDGEEDLYNNAINDYRFQKQMVKEQMDNQIEDEGVTRIRMTYLGGE